MSLSRSARSLLRQPLRTSAPLTTRLTTTPFNHQLRRSFGDYGSGAGDPKGENPQDQGVNPSADKEHPGPPPPSAGQGSGGGPTKGTEKGHNTTKQGSNTKPSVGNDPTQKREFSTSTFARRMMIGGRGGARGYASQAESAQHGDGAQGAKPVLAPKGAPPESEQSEEVKKHNRELDQRSGKADKKAEQQSSGGEEKVEKPFW